MQGADQIEINYQNVLEQARHLEELSQELSKISNSQLSETIEQLQVAWTGDASNHFASRMAVLQHRMARRDRDLRSVSEVLAITAKRYRDLEMTMNALFGR